MTAPLTISGVEIHPQQGEEVIAAVRRIHSELGDQLNRKLVEYENLPRGTDEATCQRVKSEWQGLQVKIEGLRVYLLDRGIDVNHVAHETKFDIESDRGGAEGGRHGLQDK